MRRASDAADLALVIHGAEFGRLRQGHDFRARVVDVSAARDDFKHASRGEFALAMRRQQQLRSAGEKLWGTAFVGFDVCCVGADDGLVGLAERREGDGVGRRAVEDEEDFRIGFEQLPKPVADLVGGVVVAVGCGVAAVGLVESGERLRANAGGVVAGKLQEIAGGVGRVSGHLGIRSVARSMICGLRMRTRFH